MTTTEKTNPNKTARIVGILFIVWWVMLIVGPELINSITGDPDYFINVSANENQVLVGVLLELIVASVVVGIAVMLFPIFKEHNEALALGYVGFRIFEGVIYIAGAISALLLLTLSQEYVAGAPDASYFQTLGTVLLAARDWTYMLATYILFNLGALMFYYWLYQSKLVPRLLSVWGLVGATLSLAAGLLAMFGLVALSSTISFFLVLPIALNEIVLAVWLIVKGFNSSAIASESAKTV